MKHLIYNCSQDCQVLIQTDSNKLLPGAEFALNSSHLNAAVYTTVNSGVGGTPLCYPNTTNSEPSTGAANVKKNWRALSFS